MKFLQSKDIVVTVDRNLMVIDVPAYGFGGKDINQSITFLYLQYYMYLYFHCKGVSFQ